MYLFLGLAACLPELPQAEKPGSDTAVGDTVADDTGELPVDADEDGWPTGDDCDDGDSEVHPTAIEICDGIDNNCDGQEDEGVLETYYADVDDDGFGDQAAPADACERPAGHVAAAGDCDDRDPDAWPANTEICDEIDNDCDSTIDEELQSAFYADRDGDGFGDAASEILACVAPEGFVPDASDCDDATIGVHPDAAETCDGTDTNCSGDEADASDPASWYPDGDGDGYGAGSPTLACEAPAGHVVPADDCDDADDTIHPGAVDRCNGVDENCVDGEDDATDRGSWYADVDGDGFGAGAAVLACDAPTGHVADDGDCDDAEETTFPGAEETCDGVDNDCDTATTEAGVVSVDGGGAYSAIQDAIDAASAGSTVTVCAGTYTESITIDDDLILTGREGAVTTILQGAGSSVVAVSGGDVTLSGLTLSGGVGTSTSSGDEGGGVYATTTGTLTITETVVTDNEAKYGGGIYANGTRLILTAVELSRNDVGTASGGGLLLDSGELVASGVTFEDNVAGYGAGAYVTSSDAEIEASTFADGEASVLGGGLYFTAGDLTLDTATFTDNVVASVLGGGLALFDATAAITDSTFSGNAGGAFGGAILADDSDVTLSDSELRDNDAAKGGGIYVGGATVAVSNSTLSENSSTDDGGAVYVGGAGSISLSSCTITSNLAGGYGGGARLENGTLSMTKTDWGTGATDNADDHPTHHDMAVGPSTGVTNWWIFGTDTLTCTLSGCS